MKKTATAFIAILLAGSAALLSACSRDDHTEMSGGESSLFIGDSSFDISIPEESSEESVEPESSADDSSEDSVPEESSEESIYIPPLGTPSKLIPIIEFGFGRGNYKLGYKTDENGFINGPQ